MTANRSQSADRGRSDPGHRSAVYDADDGRPYIADSRSQTAPQPHLPSIHDSERQRLDRGQNLGQLLHDAGPNSSSGYSLQEPVSESTLAENFQLKVQLEEYRKASEEQAQTIEGLKVGQQWAYDMLMKQTRRDDGAAKTETQSGLQETETMPGLVKAETLEYDEEDDGGANKTPDNTSKARQGEDLLLDADDADEDEADGGGGRRVPPGARPSEQSPPIPAHDNV